MDSGTQRLLEEGRGTTAAAKTNKMSFSVSCKKNHVMLIALALAFVVVNVFLYKQSTHIVIAQFLGYTMAPDTASDVHRWEISVLANSSNLASRPRTSTSSASKSSPANGPAVAPSQGETEPSATVSDDPPSPSYSPLFLREHEFLKEPIINPHPFMYRIFPNVTCSGRDITLAICVPISRGNFNGRQTVRETWGSYANSTGNNAVLVFFIGSEDPASDTGRETQIQIEAEARAHGDILQESYVDHYNNLSLKSVSILKWVTLFCPGSKYVLKADDDMYVNVPLLVRILPEVARYGPAFVVGSVQYGARPIRTASSKWYTPYSMFKGDVYPSYTSGTAYAMNAEAARLLYEASLRIPLFWLEDIYITGICASKAGVAVRDNNMFSYGKPQTSGCSFRGHISGHRYSLVEIRLIHRELYDPNTVCENSPT